MRKDNFQLKDSPYEYQNFFGTDSLIKTDGADEEKLYPGLSENERSVAASMLKGFFSIGMMCCFCDEYRSIYYADGKMCQMMGYDSFEELEKAVQYSADNAIYYADRESFKMKLGNDFYDGMEYSYTYRMPRKDGSLFWVFDKSKVTKNSDGKLVIISFCMDITEAMEHQVNINENVLSLKRRNKELQYLNNTLPVGYHRCADTPDYDFLFVSNKFLDMLGFTRQEIKDLFDDKFKNMIHPDDWKRVFEGEENMSYARRTDLRYEYRMRCKDGYIWVEDFTDYITDMGTPFFQGAIMDITQRVQLSQQLYNNIKAFRIAAKEAGNMVFTYSRQKQAIYCDEWVAKEYGLETNQTGVPYGILKGKDIVSQDSEKEYLRIHEAILHGEKAASGVVKLINTSGKENVFELTLQAVLDDSGKPTDMAVGVYKDITGQYFDTIKKEQSLKNLQEEYIRTKESMRLESRERLDMIYALSREYYALWRVDLNNDLIFLRRNENPNTEIVTEKDQQIPSSYTDSLKTYGEKWVHPDDREMLYKEANIEKIRQNLKSRDAFSVRLRRKEYKKETYGYVEWRIVRLAETEDEWTALIAVKNIDGEVLREAKQQELLKDALNQSKHANHAKTVFLSNMSHDIRTPMNAIIGFTGIAANHIEDKERVQDCLTKIMSSSNHLLNLINDILDMSRIECGKLTLQEKECCLPERIHSLVNMVRPQMHAKKLEFFVDAIDICDEYLIFDPLKLNQVLINILGNAVKFTPPKGVISFTIRQSESEKSGYSHFDFIIKDTGIGMSQDFLEHIFEPFERESPAFVSGNDGTGLGMTITKRTVDVMGGTITVESTIGKGSVFTVGFDFKRQNVSVFQKQVKELAGLRVLVVDDDSNICDSVTKMLAEIGMSSEWTTSGKDAVFRAQKA